MNNIKLSIFTNYNILYLSKILIIDEDKYLLTLISTKEKIQHGKDKPTPSDRTWG